jgi:hypothetical protein
MMLEMMNSQSAWCLYLLHSNFHVVRPENCIHILMNMLYFNKWDNRSKTYKALYMIYKEENKYICMSNFIGIPMGNNWLIFVFTNNVWVVKCTFHTLMMMEYYYLWKSRRLLEKWIYCVCHRDLLLFLLCCRFQEETDFWVSVVSFTSSSIGYMRCR